MVTAATPQIKLSPFKIFQNHNFRLMWTGQLISTMGSALTSLAASILVFRLTNSALSVSLMLMATAAPTLLVGLFAGVFVDRFDRKKIMIGADIFRAVLVLLIPLLVQHNVAWLYIIVALTSAIGQFFDPAHESVLPEVASEEELAAANSLMAISSFGSTAIGFAASGLIASAANINWAFYIDGISFFISAMLILFIRIKPLQIDEDTKTSSVTLNLKLGVKQLFQTPVLNSLIKASIPTLIAFGLSNALLLPFALRALKATEFEYGLQEAFTSIGFVVASFLLASIFDRMREGAWIAISYIGMALLGIAYSLIHSIPLAILLVTFSGFMNAPSSIGRRLVVQRNTPREMRGRVNSVFFVTRDILFLIGMSLAGLADLIDVRIVYLISSLLLLFGGVLVMTLPGLRQNRIEWFKALGILKSAPVGQPSLVGRSAVLADFDALAVLIPSFKRLSSKEMDALMKHALVIETQPGTSILRHGDAGDSAYFILKGRTVAGTANEAGEYRSLSIMNEGDFFGEIAALTGVARTADVVAETGSTLLQVPAAALRGLMANPVMAKLFLDKMTERLQRSSIQELPRFAGVDQKDAQELRAQPAG